MTRFPAELIAAVPYALGFHPEDSLVAAIMDGARLGLTARLDLLPAGAPADDGRSQAAYLARILARQRPTAVAVLGYGPPERVTPAVLRTAEALRRRGVVVIDELRITDGRWWSYRCTDSSCCPVEGLPCLPPDSSVAAAATFAGQVALPDRQALVALVEPVTGAERNAIGLATARARERLADPQFEVRRSGRTAVRAAERCYRSGGRLDDDDLAWLTVLLADEGTQEYAWSRIGVQSWRVTMWVDLVRRADPELVPWPAALLAFAAWRSGQGALAQAAVDRALTQEPEHRVALLILEILQHGLPPDVLADPPGERVRR